MLPDVILGSKIYHSSISPQSKGQLWLRELNSESGNLNHPGSEQGQWGLVLGRIRSSCEVTLSAVK